MRGTRVLLIAVLVSSLLVGPYAGMTSGHIGESTFASVVEPIGVAATLGRLLVTRPFCGDPRQVLSIDASGAVSVFATLPPRGGKCFEDYLAVAGPADPSKPGFPSPTPGGFPSNFVYVMQGPTVLKIALEGTVSTFTTIPSCQPSMNGITFDDVGTFNYHMIVACAGGRIWKVASDGAATLVADVAAVLGLASVKIENPDVAPLGFAPYGGHLFVAAGALSQVLAISPAGAVSVVASWSSAEGVHFIPAGKCTFGPSGGSFFTAIFKRATLGPGSIVQFPLSAFSGLSGRALVTSEGRAGMGLLTSTGAAVITPTTFHSSIGRHEGSAFVDCTVPLLLKIIVKPGKPRPIDPATEPTVPLVILSSPIFNAVTDTILASIRFGVTGTEKSIMSCNPEGRDMNGDGLLDLLCIADTSKLGIPGEGIFAGTLILKLFYTAPGGDPPGEGAD